MICLLIYTGEEHVRRGGNKHNLLGTDIFLHIFILIFHTYNTGVYCFSVWNISISLLDCAKVPVSHHDIQVNCSAYKPPGVR